ncbi:hypothetical protein PR003_g1615 [Phytophthora rubi]|uniref:Secreted protein n=1 Tax=Phytophthora rubi TaxID=129364 RepID=A0A6A3PC65_9STRA|nr:hypothetical protein PR002_g1498 [Phytophthora rubi]KAE9051868.1 hypothetical protein PR001_g1028 [Phytophthora rubi]KAE9357785.1 hypothetical protein PR003_g1615 [Phytophthora rubi]
MSHWIVCFARWVLHAIATEAKPTPPACLGVNNNPGLTLCLLASVLVECLHRNCFCKFRICFSAQTGISKTVAVNNTDGSMIALSRRTLFSTLFESCDAVASLRCALRIRTAQLTSVNGPVPTS